MSFDPIDALPDAPTSADVGDDFNAKAFPWVAALAAWTAQVNAWGVAANDAANTAFSAISADSVAIGTGTKNFPNASAGAAFVGGQKVIVSSDADPTVDYMIGTVSSYDRDTGALAVEVGAGDAHGSGTHADWSIGLALDADLSAYLALAGGVMAGLLDAAVELKLPNGAPGTPAVRHIWYDSGTGKVYFRNGSQSLQIIDGGSSQALYNKTLVSPVLQGTPTTDIFTITDGASVTIDPADGEVQSWALGANRAPTLTSITTGKAVLLLVDDGTAYTLTLSGVTWLNNGLAAPTLKTTGPTPILLFNVGGTLYGWLCGDGG